LKGHGFSRAVKLKIHTALAAEVTPLFKVTLPSMARSQHSTNTLNVPPATLAYRMPAEWEPHAATWLAWPHYHGDWPGKFEPIPWVYTEIIRNLARHERVDLLVNNAAAERQARKQLEKSSAEIKNVRFHRWPTNRSWLRDSGCIFCKSAAGALARESTGEVSVAKRRHSLAPHVSAGESAMKENRVPSGTTPSNEILALNFRFNAWAKYTNYRHDEKIGAQMATTAEAQKIRPHHNNTRVVLEGGSIDVNGEGTLLTTEECLLSKVQQRNPNMQRKDYEKIFADYLGAPHVIWLGQGIAGDDTHGHIDDLTRFVAPNTVVTVIEPNRKDINQKPLRDNLRRLHSATDQNGKPLNVVELPMPRPVIFEQRRLPASYANFYIANGLVLVPVFNDPNDRIALNTLAQLFPTREVVPIYCGDLVWGLGTLHCMTQQQPSA
jgi:agmatine deiminase